MIFHLQEQEEQANQITEGCHLLLPFCKKTLS